MKKAEIKVKLTGDKSGLDKTLKAGRAAINGFGNAAVAGMKLIAASAVVAAGALAYGVRQAIALGDELGDMSAKTGIAVDQLMVLNTAAKDSGIEDITGNINKLQKALVDSVKNGAGPAAQALTMLGLRGEELIKNSPVEQIKAIGEAIQKIKNPALKTSIAKDLFGKGGAGMLPMFNDPQAMEKAAQAVGYQAQILAKNAEAFGRVNDRLEHSGLKMQGFFVGVASGVIGPLDRITEKFDKLDLAKQGERFGEALRPVVNDLANLDLGKMADAFLEKIKEAASMFSFLKKANDLVGGGGAGALWKGAAAVTNSITGKKPLFGTPQRVDGDAYEGGAHQFGHMSAGVMPYKATPWVPRGTSLQSGGLKTGSNAIGEGGFRDLFGFDNQGGTLRGVTGPGGMYSNAGLSKGAYGQRSSSLGIRERRAAENAAVAAGGSRDARASGANAYNVVRSGDSRRAKGEAQRKEREENSIKRSNEHLQKIEDAAISTAASLAEKN